MTFEKLLAEAMDDDNILEDRIRKAITVLLDRYGYPDEDYEDEANRMIDQFKEDNQMKARTDERGPTRFFFEPKDIEPLPGGTACRTSNEQ